MRSVSARWLVVVGAVVLGACAGGSSAVGVSDSTGAGTASDDPAAACIASANASHTRKPDEPASIRVKHIVVKHVDGKNPGAATRSRGEACLHAAEALEKLGKGASWDELVVEYSDSPGPDKDGSLGSIARPDLEAAFADAAFELEPGQMSNVVETPIGFHIMVRTE